MLGLETRRCVTLACCAVVIASAAHAGASLDLAVNGTGLSLGDSRGIRGLRISLIDHQLEEVAGVNVTLLMARRPRRGEVRGVALGLVPGLRRCRGLVVGLVGFSVEGDASGVMLGVAGGGVANARGLLVGGIGTSVGRDARGVLIGGIGTSVGKNLVGLSAGLIGVHVGGDLRGVATGGIGTYVGGHFQGFALGGIGMYVAGDARGIAMGGVGIAIEGELHGIAVGGFSVTAPQVSGLTVGLLNGVSHDNFEFRGVNDRHHGVAIGAFNFSRQLKGLQIGLLNYAGNNPKWARLLPIINYHG